MVDIVIYARIALGTLYVIAWILAGVSAIKFHTPRMRQRGMLWGLEEFMKLGQTRHRNMALIAMGPIYWFLFLTWWYYTNIYFLAFIVPYLEWSRARLEKERCRGK